MENLLLLALLLIVAPGECQEIPDDFYVLSPYICGLAIDMELMDEREVFYLNADGTCNEAGYFFSQSRFSDDIAETRRRYQNLKDAPPVSDAMRFPDLAYVRACLCEASTFRDKIIYAIDGYPSLTSELMDLQKEASNCYLVWNCIADAKSDFLYINTRRFALKELRESLGEANYYSTTLPPHLPVWNFKEIK